MRKTIFTCLVAFMGLLAFSTAQAKTIYCGGTAADTTGQGYALWYPKMKSAVDAWSSGDSLTFIANSYDTLSTAWVTWNENNNVILGNGHHAYFAGTKYVFLGTSGDPVENLSVTNLNIHAQLNFMYGSSGTFTGGSITCPAGVTPYKTKAAIGISHGTSTLVFDGCDLLTDDEDDLYRLHIASASAHSITLNDLTTELSAYNLTTECDDATFDADGVTLDGLIGWDLRGDFQRFTLTNSVFACDSNCAIKLWQADSATVTGNDFTGWGQNDVNNNAAVCVVMPTASADLSARYYNVSDNDFEPRAFARQDRVLSAIVIEDTLDASVYNLRNNRIGAAGADKDSILYAFDITYDDADYYLDSCLIYAGAVNFELSDTLGFPGAHTFDDMVLDHSNYNNERSFDAALKILTTNQTIDRLSVTTDKDHATFLSSDDFSVDRIPGITAAGRYGSYNTFTDCDFTWLETDANMYGLVIKAIADTLVNCEFTRYGPQVANSGMILFVGDSCHVTNCEFTQLEFSGTSGSMIGMGTSHGHQPAENTVQNSKFIGECYNVYGTLQVSGSGGVAENNNNYVGLTYTDFDEDDAITLASSSFDAATGLTSGEIAARNNWGGTTATGITGTSHGFYPIGISTSSRSTTDPVITSSQAGFETPYDALQTINTIGATGIQLTHRVRNLSDLAAAIYWTQGYPADSSGTYASEFKGVLEVINTEE